jgi:hypothetical protein
MAHANVFATLAGVVSDPLKFGRLSENFKQTVLQALSQIDALADKADAIAKNRLEQVRSIIDDAIKGGMAAESQAMADINSLESKIVSDVQLILSDIQCASIVAAQGTLQNAIIQALKNVGKTNPTLKIGGYKVAEISISSPPDLPAADKIFYETRDGLLSNLKNLKDGDGAYTIISAYGNIEKLAETTRCYYKRNAFEQQFIREQFNYKVMQDAWFSTVSVQN